MRGIEERGGLKEQISLKKKRGYCEGSNLLDWNYNQRKAPPQYLRKSGRKKENMVKFDAKRNTEKC